MIYSHNDFHTELLAILDMLEQVLAPFLESEQILLGIGICERLSRGDLRPTTVHLEGTSGGNNDGGIRFESARTALDVTEFLHTHVSTKTTFRKYIANALRRITLFSTGKFQCNTVSKDR